MPRKYVNADISPARIVCDTNALVSVLLGSSTDLKIYELFKGGEIDLLFSKETLAELLNRPKFKIPPVEIRNLFRLVRKKSRIISTLRETHLRRDPKDEFILATALSGRADYLVRGDKDILALKTVFRFR